MIGDSGSARRHNVDLDALLEATSTTTSSCDDLVDLAAHRATRSTLRTRNQQTRRRSSSPTGASPFQVVEAGEPESGEPARGAWTQVSEAVPAVDNDVAYRIQLLGRLCVQLREREADRAREMELLVVLSRQDLDDLRAARDEFVELGDVDRGHGHLFVWLTGNRRSSVIRTKINGRGAQRRRYLPTFPDPSPSSLAL
jgi:hypothetical protein